MRAATPGAIVPSAAIVELRQYTLHPGQRDVLIELFDREFVETQEAVGMTVIGQFRDLERPDCFVWLRGFPDMPTRGASLKTFYEGPAWLDHRERANATMIDSDNVLLLEPASDGTGFVVGERRAEGGRRGPALIVATIYYVRPETMRGFPAFFAGSVRPLLKAAGAEVLAEYVTSTKPNNFRLPIRQGETAFAWFARFGTADGYERFRERLASDPSWRTRVGPALEAQLAKPSEVLRLSPTERSRLGG